MQNWQVKLSLFLNYFVFAILLNSVGTVILMVQQNFGVSESAASVLEPFKDLPIAITSFLVASYVARIGYKNTMLIGLGLVSTICLVMPSVPYFWMTKLLFLTIGVGFALIKVTVFATIGLITDSKKDHASFMNFLESFFMVGVLSGYFIFSAFTTDDDPGSTDWLRVYYLLAGFSMAAFVLLLTTKLDESAIEKAKESTMSGEFLGMLKLAARPLVLVFIASVFLYVLIEQSIMSWLPTFNKEILNLPVSLSIQMTSILAASTALGRFGAGFMLKKIHWHKVVTVGLIAAAILVLVCLPLAQASGEGEVTGWGNAPLAAFVFPLIGLCLAPVYPAINSVMLSSIDVKVHGPMSGLIVVFSALGGSLGSLITGSIFQLYGGKTAFYFALVPITLILITLWLFRRASDKHNLAMTGTD